MQTNRLLVLILCILMNTSTYAQLSSKFRNFFNSTWNVTAPATGAVYQRGLDNQAVIKVKGTFSGVFFNAATTTISAQLKQLTIEGNDAGMPAITVPITVVSGKSFSGQLSVSAGWYQLILKATDSFGRTSTRTTKQGVGEVFIIAGQSNAQGRENDPFNNNTVNLPLLDAVRVQPDRFDEAKFLTATDKSSVEIAMNLAVRKPVFSPLVSGREAYNNSNSGIAPLGNSL